MGTRVWEGHGRANGEGSRQWTRVSCKNRTPSCEGKELPAPAARTNLSLSGTEKTLCRAARFWARVGTDEKRPESDRAGTVQVSQGRQIGLMARRLFVRCPILPKSHGTIPGEHPRDIPQVLELWAAIPDLSDCSEGWIPVELM